MIVGRLAGWLFVILAAAALGYEMTAAVQAGAWRLIALGELWYRIDPASLNVSQAGIQRHVAPWLWEPVITSVLLLPAWVALGIPGAALVWGFRRRSKAPRGHRKS